MCRLCINLSMWLLRIPSSSPSPVPRLWSGQVTAPWASQHSEKPSTEFWGKLIIFPTSDHFQVENFLFFSCWWSLQWDVSQFCRQRQVLHCHLGHQNSNQTADYLDVHTHTHTHTLVHPREWPWVLREQRTLLEEDIKGLNDYEWTKIALDGWQVVLDSWPQAVLSLWCLLPSDLPISSLGTSLCFLLSPSALFTPQTTRASYLAPTAQVTLTHLCQVLGSWTDGWQRGWGSTERPLYCRPATNPLFLGAEPLRCVRYMSAHSWLVVNAAEWMNESEWTQQMVVPFLLPSPWLPLQYLLAVGGLGPRRTGKFSPADRDAVMLPFRCPSPHPHSTLSCPGEVGVGEAQGRATPSLQSIPLPPPALLHPHPLPLPSTPTPRTSIPAPPFLP